MIAREPPSTFRPRPIAAIASAILLLSSCVIGTGLGAGEAREDFDEADRPAYVHDPERDFMLMEPWNYGKPWNARRSYPLVVALHGSGGSHYAPCMVGDDAEMQEHPAFFLSPTCPDWGGSAAWVRALIEELKAEYRIDSDRLYLMGFSMGGSGSYSFARAYLEEQGGLFAGIVRLAGQSQAELPDAIVRKTSVWYHVGLLDTEARVEVAEQAYDFMKSHPLNASARESTAEDEVGRFARSTRTLTKGGVQIMKLSRYEGMGHDGSSPFGDPEVLDWLFAQDLGER